MIQMDDKYLQELKQLVRDAENLVQSKRSFDNIISIVEISNNLNITEGHGYFSLNNHSLGGKLLKDYKLAFQTFKANVIHILQEEKRLIDNKYKALGKTNTFRVKEEKSTHPIVETCRVLDSHSAPEPNLMKTDEEIGVGDAIPSPLEVKKKAITSQVIRIVGEQLGVAEYKITLESSPEDFGADSLDTVELVMELEDDFDINIEEEDAYSFKTIQDIVDYLMLKV